MNGINFIAGIQSKNFILLQMCVKYAVSYASNMNDSIFHAIMLGNLW